MYRQVAQAGIDAGGKEAVERYHMADMRGLGGGDREGTHTTRSCASIGQCAAICIGVQACEAPVGFSRLV
jgi:hypothetical protein